MAKKRKRSEHKFTGRNNSPARERYWRENRLRERKIRNLMRHNGLTRAAAYLLWTSVRRTRMKTYGQPKEASSTRHAEALQGAAS